MFWNRPRCPRCNMCGAVLAAVMATACSNFLSPSEPTPAPDTGATFKVTAAAAGVDSSSSSGPCPRRVTFTGTITTNAAGAVTYKWERHDGAASPNTTMTFAGAGSQTNTITWETSGSGWQQLHVLSPNDVKSNQAAVSVSCTAGP